MAIILKYVILLNNIAFKLFEIVSEKGLTKMAYYGTYYTT